jgi:hypothetical protein
MSTSTHVITTGLAWLQTPYPILQYTLGGLAANTKDVHQIVLLCKESGMAVAEIGLTTVTVLDAADAANKPSRQQFETIARRCNADVTFTSISVDATADRYFDLLDDLVHGQVLYHLNSRGLCRLGTGSEWIVEQGALNSMMTKSHGNVTTCNLTINVSCHRKLLEIRMHTPCTYRFSRLDDLELSEVQCLPTLQEGRVTTTSLSKYPVDTSALFRQNKVLFFLLCPKSVVLMHCSVSKRRADSRRRRTPQQRWPRCMHTPIT